METFPRCHEHRSLYCHCRRFHEHFHVEIQARVPGPHRRRWFSRRRSHWNYPNCPGIWLAKYPFGDVQYAHHPLGSVRKKDGRRKWSRSCGLLLRHVLQVGTQFPKHCFLDFLLPLISYGLAFSFGTTLLLRGEINVGIIVNVFLAIMIGSFSLVMLAPEMQAVANARGAAAKLFATIDRNPPLTARTRVASSPRRSPARLLFTMSNSTTRAPRRSDS
jgi:hypothetical protein